MLTTLMADMKNAMKNKEKDRLQALRNMISNIKGETGLHLARHGYKG